MNCEAIHCFDTASVRFAIYPEGLDGPRVLAEITEDALRDLYGARGGGDSLVQACQANFSAIESKALEMYVTYPRRPIRLRTQDLEPSQAPVSVF